MNGYWLAGILCVVVGIFQGFSGDVALMFLDVVVGSIFLALGMDYPEE
jgi:hypothetical protein